MQKILFYSTNSWLAYTLSNRFYGGMHWVWCGPEFSPTTDSATPPSSSPIEIYRRLQADVSQGDRHSRAVRNNRIGLLRGAAQKRKSGQIDERMEQEIGSVVRGAGIRDFRPLLYVIPGALAVGSLIEVPVNMRAAPLSEEYILPDLRRDAFHVLRFEY